MSSLRYFIATLAAVTLAQAQGVDFCKGDDCADCPASISTVGTGYPECVIYDTQTVFGGQGYEEGTGKFLYNVFGNFGEPAANCNIMIRSPASLTQNGCGNLIFNTNKAQCSNEINLQDTFMVQFCCGEGDCTKAGVPFKRDGNFLIGGHSARGAVLSGGQYIRLANGTLIEPKETGSIPQNVAARQDCNGYVDQSYQASQDPFLTTFDTQIISSTVGPYTEDTDIERTYTQTVEESTSFDTSVGDPFGIISVSVGFEFSTSTADGVAYKVPVPAGAVGRIGFTPVFRCTAGSLEACAGGRVDGQACTPYVIDGVVQGDYTLVQS